jgi:hypothetical protein
VTDAELRSAVQRCRSRILLAVAALDAYQERFTVLAGPLPIAAATELIAMTAGIRLLLTGEEGEDV